MSFKEEYRLEQLFYSNPSEFRQEAEKLQGSYYVESLEHSKESQEYKDIMAKSDRLARKVNSL